MKTNYERLNFIKSLNLKYDRDTDNDIAKYYPNGSIIGGCGFGWEWDGERLIRFPHRGGVKIGRNVQVGANSCIDRATLEGNDTVIGEGTKIDNLVHIAHNCQIGKHNLIVAGAVLCGGVVTGDQVFIGANATIKQKVKIGDNAIIGMGAVVIHDVPAGETWAGNPARKIK